MSVSVSKMVVSGAVDISHANKSSVVSLKSYSLVMIDSSVVSELSQVSNAIDVVRSDASQVLVPANTLQVAKASQVSDSLKADVSQSSKISSSSNVVNSCDMTNVAQLPEIPDSVNVSNSDLSLVIHASHIHNMTKSSKIIESPVSNILKSSQIVDSSITVNSHHISKSAKVMKIPGSVHIINSDSLIVPMSPYSLKVSQTSQVCQSFSSSNSDISNISVVSIDLNSSQVLKSSQSSKIDLSLLTVVPDLAQVSETINVLLMTKLTDVSGLTQSDISKSS